MPEPLVLNRLHLSAITLQNLLTLEKISARRFVSKAGCESGEQH